MNRMKIPQGKALRLSDDVWQLALTHAKQEGLGSPREAIERMVRLFAANAVEAQTN